MTLKSEAGKYAKITLNAVLAGLMLGIAGTVNLSVSDRVIGAFLFGFGLLVILCYDFKLFTGAVGYAVNQKNGAWRYWIALAFIWFGNFVGATLAGVLISGTRLVHVSERAGVLCDAKLADGGMSLFVLSILCGILMYIAVESYRSEQHPGVVRVLIVFLCVGIFILSGFEHCIANMFYFSVSGRTGMQSLQALGVMTCGNALGGILIPLADKVRK